MAEHKELGEKFSDMFDVPIRIYGTLDGRGRTKLKDMTPKEIKVFLSKYDLQRLYDDEKDAGVIKWMESLADSWSEKFGDGEYEEITSKSDLKGLYMAWADEMGVDLSDIKFRIAKMKTRLGSFIGYVDRKTNEPVDATLSISDSYLFFDTVYAETTIVHELAHAWVWQEHGADPKHDGHSKTFWDKVYKHLPNYDSLEDEYYELFEEMWGVKPTAH